MRRLLEDDFPDLDRDLDLVERDDDLREDDLRRREEDDFPDLPLLLDLDRDLPDRDDLERDDLDRDDLDRDRDLEREPDLDLDLDLLLFSSLSLPPRRFFFLRRRPDRGSLSSSDELSCLPYQ